ncbi:protein-disulfide reductase DsbD domain-containing protein [Pseudohoeflea coraliihabitans]|uniref:Thiol:disulfide interchange protein DsbD N-terminal domain-containing protein n=1 Tax=Pseudohoeflea coraliihabitans TaxID=2860393 RepID=A0ABS6WLU2_9HYPH|nr:protein-disulfide reductase DsbD domain-containing protein [Pseudohoeflea sp. DP4N28-3]MBW3096926.1 hypothetical protein [Pseudohoeflea sp. DP4N28-3]
MMKTRQFLSGMDRPIRSAGSVPAFAAAILFLLSSEAALALATDWATTKGGRMRLVIDPAANAQGITRGVLEIDLEPGWKTYWIDPGGSGVPPQITLDHSTGIELEALRLPAPRQVDDGYSVWAGYTQPVAFGLEFSRQGAAQLEADIFVGICEKICIPFQTHFSLAIPAAANSAASAGDSALVAATFRALPSAPQADFKVQSLRYQAGAGEKGAGQLHVVARLPEFRPGAAAPDLFIASGEGWIFGAAQLLGDDGEEARFSVPVIRQPDNPETAKNGFYTVLSIGRRAVETTVSLTPGG